MREIVRHGKVTFRDNFEKAAYLARKSEEDCTDSLVQWWATVFAPIVGQRAKVRAIHHFIAFGIEYVRDPNVEVLDGAGVLLMRGYGDCDAKSRAFVALCLLNGIPARSNAVLRENGLKFPHVRAEVFLDGKWVVVDPILVNDEIGRLPSRPLTSWRDLYAIPFRPK